MRVGGDCLENSPRPQARPPSDKVHSGPSRRSETEGTSELSHVSPERPSAVNFR
jgi:hypothetical protein